LEINFVPQQTGFFRKFSPKKHPVAVGLFKGAKLRIMERMGLVLRKFSFAGGNPANSALSQKI